MEKSFFSMERSSRELMSAVAQRLSGIHRDATQKFVSSKNVHSLRHGDGWRLWSTGDASDDVQFKLHSAEIETSLEDVANHRIEILVDALDKASKKIEAQFAESVYGMLHETCDSSGNVVSAGPHESLAELFYSAIEKIEFVADRFGNVSLPSVHAGREVAARMLEELESAPEEFKKKFEDLKARKTEAALLSESKRKARFMNYGGVE